MKFIIKKTHENKSERFITPFQSKHGLQFEHYLTRCGRQITDDMKLLFSLDAETTKLRLHGKYSNLCGYIISDSKFTYYTVNGNPLGKLALLEIYDLEQSLGAIINTK